MRLEFAFLATTAEVKEDGVMNVLGGGIDQVQGPSFPATHSGFCLIARVRADPDECNRQHLLTARVFRPDGQPWVPESNLSFEAKPNKLHPERGNYVTCCFVYRDFIFPEAGEYTFRLYVGGNEVGHVNVDALLKEKG